MDSKIVPKKVNQNIVFSMNMNGSIIHDKNIARFQETGCDRFFNSNGKRIGIIRELIDVEKERIR